MTFIEYAIARKAEQLARRINAREPLSDDEFALARRVIPRALSYPDDDAPTADLEAALRTLETLGRAA